MLADEIITRLSEETVSLNEILLKTKIFLHEIGKKELAEWVNSELNGYANAVAVPDYRIIPSAVRGNVMNGVWSVQSQLLPVQNLPPKILEDLEKTEMRDAISIVEEYASKKSLHRPLSPEYYGIFAKGLTSGWYVTGAWTEISTTAVQNILAQVRSRLLDFMLELRDTVQDKGEKEINRANTANIDTTSMFNRAVFGDNTTIVVGNNNRQSVTAGVRKDEFASLRQALSSVGVPEDELDSLEVAVNEDRATLGKPSFEGKTGNWFTQLLGRAAKGTVAVGVDLVSSVVAKSLTNYIGS
jgi:hypothetical protein